MEVLLVSDCRCQERFDFADIVKDAQEQGIKIKYSLVPKKISYEDITYTFVNVEDLTKDKSCIVGKKFDDVYLTPEAKDAIPLGLLSFILTRIR